MKAVIVAPHFYPRVGGVESYTLNIATRLTGLGWQVVVVTSAAPGDSERSTIAGMSAYRLRPDLTISNTPVGLHWRRELRKIFNREQPEIINAHTPVPYLADIAERASGRIPFVLTYHNDLEKDAFLQKAMVGVLQRTVINRTVCRSTQIIATSDHYVSESRYLRGHESKISVVSPGVDLSKFNPRVHVSDDLASTYSARRVILFVGSLNRSQRYKGLDQLIGAFAAIRATRPDTHLIVVGQGDGLDMYKSMAVQEGVADEVTFTGYVSDELLAQYYKLATVFAMPSTDRSEGFGMVYAEAGAVGVPVIGSRVGGVPYAVLDNETGLLVSPRDVDDLCRALASVLDSPELAQRLGEAGAARAVAELDWETVAKRTSEIFASVCRSRPSIAIS